MLLVSPFVHPEKLLPAEHIAFVTESVSAHTENPQKGPDPSKEVRNSLCVLHRTGGGDVIGNKKGIASFEWLFIIQLSFVV